MKTFNGYLSSSENDKQSAEFKVREIINRYGGFIVRPINYYLNIFFMLFYRPYTLPHTFSNNVIQ